MPNVAYTVGSSTIAVSSQAPNGLQSGSFKSPSICMKVGPSTTSPAARFSTTPVPLPSNATTNRDNPRIDPFGPHMSGKPAILEPGRSEHARLANVQTEKPFAGIEVVANLPEVHVLVGKRLAPDVRSDVLPTDIEVQPRLGARGNAVGIERELIEPDSPSLRPIGHRLVQ